MNHALIESLTKIIRSEEYIHYSLGDNRKTCFHFLDIAYKRCFLNFNFLKLTKRNVSDLYIASFERCFIALCDALQELQAIAFESDLEYQSCYINSLEKFADKFGYHNHKISVDNLFSKTSSLYDYAYNFLLDEYLKTFGNPCNDDIDIKKTSHHISLRSTNKPLTDLAMSINEDVDEYSSNIKIFIKENNEWKNPSYNQYTYRIIAIDFLESLLKEYFHKHPNYYAPIIKKARLEFFNYDKAFILAENLLANRSIIKNKTNILDLLNNKEHSIEKINDLIDKIDENHSVEKFAKSIMSNKYLFLIKSDNNEIFTHIDKQIFSVFKEIKNSSVSPSKLQDFIGKKLASFKTKEDFESSLIKLFNSYNSFHLDSILEKSSSFNCDVVYNKGNKLILKINDYKASDKLGSSSWCISNYQNYWNQYVDLPKNHQYFIYDFNKPSSNVESLIGITISTQKGVSLHSAHLKNDSFAKNNPNVLDYFDIIKEIEFSRK